MKSPKRGKFTEIMLFPPHYTWQFFAFLISREKARKITNFSRKSEKIARKLKNDISTLVNYKKLGPYHMQITKVNWRLKVNCR